MNILHISRNMNVESDGIDTVFKSIVENQNSIESLNVSSIVTSKYSDLIENKKDIKNSDICIFHRMYDFKSLILMIYCILINKKYILFPHSGFTNISQNKSKIKKKILRYLILDHIISRASAIHYLTENEKVSSFPKVSSFVVPNGIDIPKLLLNKKYTNSYNYIAFLGRYDVNHKGIDILFRSIFINKSLFQEKKVQLIMHGYYSHSRDKDAMDQLMENYQLHDIVEIRGGIFGQDKIDFLNSSMAYILTSRYEGMPLSILEALSLNKPCLVTEGTNLVDLVTSNSWGLGSDTTADDVSKMLHIFLNNPEAFSNIDSRCYVEMNFSWRKISSDLAILYKQIVDNNEL
ncbi:glycosyltransferase [Vibrio sp. 1567]|uniref:glycosyltransferase n=1 Tax=Vibrio sp. 1567 TaxID=3074564 RepID=UPI002963E746|nr:glycosyltransferase [Vibrio sp. 1567]MDW2169812.1 glycosyltransferase [Vibrio sp. 1567]